MADEQIARLEADVKEMQQTADDQKGINEQECDEEER